VRLLVIVAVLLSSSLSDAESVRFSALALGLHAGYGDERQTDRWQQFSISGQWRWQHWRIKAGSGWLKYSDGEQGISDSWLTATYLFQKHWLGHWWDIRGRLKFPSADASRSLGTGSLDQGLRLQALKQWNNQLLWYYLGYRRRGPSDEFKLQNSWRWGAGIKVRDYSLFYDGRQASQPGLDNTHSLTLMASIKQRKYLLSPYLGIEQNGDWSCGVSLRF
jgi:hypothetical protein